ncbi:MAG TPA: beta-ketoacyl-ACP synthase II, partial [Solirubrobacteraceae bacterium]|nr:beta-ketoacyl-ACP synthase II [Solirubrobacteraceae bacterium]
ARRVNEVVVTGLGAVSPLGVGAQTLFERWAAGVCGIVDGEGVCDEFVATDHFTVKEARRADRFAQLVLVAAREALEDAGWGEGLPYEASAIGAIIGTGIGGIGTIEANDRQLFDHGPKAVSPLAVPLMMGNAGAAAVSMRHGLKGPSYGVVSACAAGNHAIGAAMRAIQYGDATAVVTGSTEAALTPLSKAAFVAVDALSPTGISRPFDARRDGFVMGEGAGVLVLENGEAARARGATILATVRGYGASSDAHHITAPPASGEGAATAIALALADAGLRPEQIVYVNAHGTSTPINDRAETAALKTALGEHAHRVPISSTKSAIGHLLGGAGSVEAVATILALRNRTIPPTLGLEQPDPELDLDYVPLTARALELADGQILAALSSSFGFGGHNAVLCLEAT